MIIIALLLTSISEYGTRNLVSLRPVALVLVLVGRVYPNYPHSLTLRRLPAVRLVHPWLVVRALGLIRHRLVPLALIACIEWL